MIPWVSKLSASPRLSSTLRQALAACRAPVVAVSPVVAGRAVKGPTAKLMQELDLEVSAVTVAAHYAGLIDGYVLDRQDAALLPRIGLTAVALPTVMRSLEDRDALARGVLAFARDLSTGPRLRMVS